MMEKTLSTWGWLPWSDAVGILQAAPGLWLGHSGVHHHDGSWPRVMPAATRIHAWSQHSWPLWRLIPDPSRGLVLLTQLSHDTPAQAVAPHAARSTLVVVSNDADWQRFRVSGVTPILFLRPAAATRAEAGLP